MCYLKNGEFCCHNNLIFLINTDIFLNVKLRNRYICIEKWEDIDEEEAKNANNMFKQAESLLKNGKVFAPTDLDKY